MSDWTALDRCLAVLDRRVPDRVPVCLENFMQAAHFAGFTVEAYCLDGDNMADAHIATWEHFRHDMIDLENGVTALAQAVGCAVAFEHENAAPWITAPALENIEQIDRLPTIDPNRDGTLPEMLKATRRLKAALGDRVCLLAEADQGPFSLAAQILDPQVFLVTLMDPDQEPLVRRLLDYTTEQVLIYARALIDAGAHLTMMGESISGPDVCSPRLYRRFALPYQQRVVETLRAEGKRIGLHVCGNATPIIAPLASMEAAFLQVDYKIDRQTCKQAAAGKTTLIGTVDPSAVLALGTPDEVTRAARQDIDLLAPSGGFILSPGCTLPYDTPAENVAALVAAAVDYGYYGADGSTLISSSH